ncbi:similar to helicase required for RNAi-mediated heterochromatin assembly 1 [Plenodomus lingam JN3]|uniref:Similar to helicase required for RNAi-mediated heterochromatin assembly 1 n=1 Tax=Leptosphaeria maculans (strain JN3 / isolate v23.1.3 / race Av1-4-5-6-7-8) TaxID=985895 RepID=E5ACG2_LEPMJ|nr:similar to helicase required for RNAi-mediated heterochromatin assembly 1 [Plenodomus lingam JN3]CBY02164.1 similar to helicase required for RNAi-mediated heterochromatin assembly 1 [Plenodomus lingam JN3]
MTRSSRGRPNRPNQQRGNRSNRPLRGDTVQLDNPFESLENLGHDDGEVNAHLHERFGSGNMIPHDDIPTSAGPHENDDIQNYFKLAEKEVIGAGEWLDKPEIPTSSEILRKQTGFRSIESENLIEVDENIQPHKVEGPYERNEHYLRTKYELFREDAVRPLRETIDVVRADPFKDEAEYGNNNIGIYDPVYITSLVFSPRGLATRVAFSLSRVKKQIRWEQSKRLITGTLVALSPIDDAFQTQCVLATVAARPLSAMEQNPPEIDLFFARPEEQEIDPMRKWIMVECRSSFFEASRHTLLALQHMMREPFPLSKYLVSVEKEVDAPAYVRYNPYMNLSSLVSLEESADFENVNVLETWPSGSSHSLDKSQGKALKRMLTKELALVQGPPGTGKTFVSIVALQIARDNLRKDDSPIIVTAQTNHALDQLLRHTAQFEPNYIRLGGRSKDKEIKKRTLFEVRSGLPHQKRPGSKKVVAMTSLKNLTAKAQFLLAPLEANKPPLDHKLLEMLGLITREQAESLEMESQCTMGISSNENPGLLMEQWLGRCLAPCNRPIGPDDYDWAFEEEDLDVEQLQELEAEAVAKDDDDLEALRGPVTLLRDNYMGRGRALTQSQIRKLLRTDDLTTVGNDERGAIYNHFMRETKRLVLAEIREIAKKYSKVVQERKIGLWEEDVRVLRKARIIGCTTTGLSKYRGLLSGLRPRICLVEEAAETLEAPVTAACFPTLEHLVLVGDHQQLRPHTQVKEFEDAPYYLNLSMFERLVWNDVEFDTLARQRRMIPEIRRLLYPIYESTLKDHESVKDVSNRPPVEGMGGNNSFFFCHEWPEDRDANKSTFNEREAAMIVGYFDYLVLNGVDAAKITVLTFYNGQRKTILRKLREHSNLRSYVSVVKVVTVDSYQGEENDIVLLSLVRSTTRNQTTTSLVRSSKPHKIGFLSSENRACVALSRAKRGFYIFGNAELLACESGTWAAVIDIMYGNKKFKVVSGQTRRIGYQFPLQCSVHGRKIWVEEPGDWELLHGGCDIRCTGVLPCQHRCPYMCHPFEHDRVNCTQQCSRRIEACGHACVGMYSPNCAVILANVVLANVAPTASSQC